MKVNVTLQVIVDRQRIRAEYGSDDSAAQVREWIEMEVQQAASHALRVVEARVHVIADRRKP